ncbi:UNVERIFIED_CONTAM: Short-chain dehydrogenase reductase ATA1 [Sesamum latifolium]|uniref:Short-chain dehydrogenase reductase ATA1 n=1 Tax=Sesamum latifolium TaxID=2727402 RepID=A0AAW2YF65_9LAMI
MDSGGRGTGDVALNLVSKRLLGKVAVITGGARGIGAATAQVFAENGAHVIIADILDEPGAKLADSIGGRYVHCDVSVEHDVERAVQLAIDWKGRLDIMFNNAGYLGKTAGSIICSSSSAAIMGGLASHSYTLSKEAILGLARSTACELGVHGIRVNCVSPHGVPTEILISAYRKVLGNPDLQPEDVSKIVGERGSLLRGRAGRLEDVAQAVLFLASDDAGFITGHNLIIDGGYTCANNQLSGIYQG